MDEDVSVYEVEDIMCDQVIISTEVDLDFRRKRSSITISTAKLRLIVALLTGTLLPTFIKAYYAYIKNQKSLVANVRRLAFPTLVAILANYISKSFASVQNVTFPSNLPQIQAANESPNDETPEKCVECNVLHEPTGQIAADIIFVHGLHGALHKTWKQGMWKHQKHKINTQQLKKSLSIGSANGRINLKRSVSDTSVEYVLAPNKIARKHFADSINNNFFMEEPEKDEDISHGVVSDFSPCWPKEWLPKDFPDARVIALNYSTDPYLWRPWWVKKRNRTSMVERSKEMVQHLINLGVGKRPIIWVGHSKGGLFVKQILVDSSKSFSEIYTQTKGILFYSVPHRGSIFADFCLPLLRRSIELTEIQRNCPFVLDLHEKFLKIFEDKNFNPEVFSFIETSFTFMSFMYFKIVSYDSADPGVGQICGVPLDHREICKPAGRDCVLYKELLNVISSALNLDKEKDEIDS